MCWKYSKYGVINADRKKHPKVEFSAKEHSKKKSVTDEYSDSDI